MCVVVSLCVCSPAESPVVKKAAAAPIAEEGKPSSKALPVLPPRRKHVVAGRKAAEEPVAKEEAVAKEVEKEAARKQQQEEEERVQQKLHEEEVERKRAELKQAAEEALAATAAAAAAQDAAQTIANAEKVSDIVDDQIRMSREEAIEAVVEIVEAEAVVERAVEEADAVIEESKKEESKKEESKKEEAKPFPAISGPPKKKKKKKEEEVVEAPMAIEHVFTVGDLRGKTLSGKVTTEDKSQPLLPEEEEDAFESLDEVEHPALSFANAPDDKDENVGEKEKMIRDEIVHSHQLAYEAKTAQMSGNPQQAGATMKKAIQKAQAALDSCIKESETNGNIRPSLVAATAFCLADVMTHAYGGRPPANELKVAFAVALEAIKNSGEDSRKGGKSKAYTQYGALLSMQGKPRSALASYLAAYDAAKTDYGDLHEIVEQAKYDYTGYLAKCGRSRDCVDFLLKSAKELLETADALEAEAQAKGEKGEKEEEVDAPEDAKSGDGDESGVQKLPKYNLARHFAMRNMLNAAGVLDTRGDHVESQEVLADVLELAIRVHGENSRQHMNALYAIGTHCKAREAIDEAIACHEAVLNIMDATIQVYDPERLQNRVAILKDTAQLYDLQGQPEVAVEYAEGACVNAQTLARIYATTENFPLASRIGMLEPFWQLLIDLKTKIGDSEGAAKALRERNKGRMNLTGVSQGHRGSRRAPASRSMGRQRR